MIVILFLILIFILIFQYTQSIEIDKQIKIIQSKIMKLIEHINRDFTDVELFAIAGTALGCARHNDIIPWDDDVDLGIDESEVDKFLEISKEKKYKLTKELFGYKIWSDDIFIDIFIMGYRDNKYAYMSNWAYDIFTREYFERKEDIFPTYEHKFGNLTIRVPNTLYSYCDRCFPNWRKIAKINPPHYLGLSNYQKTLRTIIFSCNPFISKSFEL